MLCMQTIFVQDFETLLRQTELNRKRLIYHIHIESLLDRLGLDVTLQVYIFENNKTAPGLVVYQTHMS